MAVCLQFDDVSKAYPIYGKPGDRLKELLSPVRKSFHRDYWAIRNVSFTVEPGEVLCLLGENGSGKSTLLQLAAQILLPTSGSVKVEGRTAALLELGSGFNGEFNGRDNIYMNATILGLSRREIDNRYQRIIDFAGIGDFISQPVKTYSSGMAVRLGFSVAIHCDPQLLLVDEALAVGDVAFREKCLSRIGELRQSGVTILLVSHTLKDIKTFGTRALWLDQAHLREIGDVDGVLSRYLAHISQKDTLYARNHREEGSKQEFPDTQAPSEERIPTHPIATTILNIDHRWGNGRAAVRGIQLLDALGAPALSIKTGEDYVIRVTVETYETVPNVRVQLLMRNHLGMPFSTMTTERERQEMCLKAGQLLTVEFGLTVPELYSAHFSLSPAVLEGTKNGEAAVCDWIDNAISFEVVSGKLPIYGFVHVPCRVTASNVSRVANAP